MAIADATPKPPPLSRPRGKRVGGDPQGKSGPSMWKIIDHLFDCSAAKSVDMAKQLGLTAGAASKACQRLLEIGWARRIGVGTYEATERARTVVKAARDALRRAKIRDHKNHQARLDRIARSNRRHEPGDILPERRQHDEIVFERRAITDEKGKVVDQAYGPRIATQTMLDRYLVRGFIDRTQWKAGNRFRSHWHRAGLTPRTVVNLASGGANGSDPWRGLNGTNKQLEARDELKTLIRALGKTMAGILIDVACFDMTAADWAKSRRRPGSDGIAVLRAALDEVAAIHEAERRNRSQPGHGRAA